MRSLSQLPGGDSAQPSERAHSAVKAEMGAVARTEQQTHTNKGTYTDAKKKITEEINISSERDGLVWEWEAFLLFTKVQQEGQKRGRETLVLMWEEID